MTDFGIHASSEGLICGDPLLSSLHILAGSEANQARVKGGLLEKGSRSKEAGQGNGPNSTEPVSLRLGCVWRSVSNGGWVCEPLPLRRGDEPAWYEGQS